MALSPAYVFPLEIWDMIISYLSQFSSAYLQSLARTHPILLKRCRNLYKKRVEQVNERGYYQSDVDWFCNANGIWYITKSCWIRLCENILCKQIIIAAKPHDTITFDGQGHALRSTLVNDPNKSDRSQALILIDGDGFIVRIEYITLDGNPPMPVIAQLDTHTDRQAILNDDRPNAPVDRIKNMKKEMEKRKKQAQKLENRYRRR